MNQGGAGNNDDDDDDQELLEAIQEASQAIAQAVALIRNYAQRVDVDVENVQQFILSLRENIASWAILLQETANLLFVSNKQLQVGERGGMYYVDSRNKKIYLKDEDLVRCQQDRLPGVQGRCSAILAQSKHAAAMQRRPQPAVMRLDGRTRRQLPPLPPLI